MTMRALGTRRLASLDATMLDRRGLARRVPLSFALFSADEAFSADDAPALARAPEPEVVRQVVRLTQVFTAEPEPAPASVAPAMAEPAPAASVVAVAVAAEPARRKRVAFTLRLDAEHHRQLRQIAGAQHRSAQQVMIEALECYSVGLSDVPALATTGNQP